MHQPGARPTERGVGGWAGGRVGSQTPAWEDVGLANTPSSRHDSRATNKVFAATEAKAASSRVAMTTAWNQEARSIMTSRVNTVLAPDTRCCYLGADTVIVNTSYT